MNVSNSISQINPYNSSNSNISGASPSFQQSNSLVANFTFLILVVFGFIILLRIGMMILGFFLTPNDSPRLLNGMIKGTQPYTIFQDSSKNNTKTIYRSVNENKGIEFTWSVWVFITDIEDSDLKYRHVFSKGDSVIDTNGINGINAPGLYLAPNSNKFIVIMNTFEVINEEIEISDIPMNKWVNVIIRCRNTTLDVYINGTITRSVYLNGVPKQNFGNVYLASHGGFDGYISNLWYYNHALGTSDIQRLSDQGPNTKMISPSTGMNDTMFDYLSLRWFFYGTGSGFNPS
jgi:hypothetical protein